MIVAVKDHQGKSRALVDALRTQGWFVVPLGAPADLLLIDHDVNRPGWRDVIDAYAEFGAKIVLYPHGANVICSWDGPEEPYPVDACLVIGQAHREVMETYGYPRPMHIIGWSFCEQKPFQPREAKRVLFAPTHPLGNGYLNDEQKQANQIAYEQVLQWGLPVTVRHVGPLSANGLERRRGVEYERAHLSLGLGSLDDHDLVVARETMLSMAIARGIPAMTYHQACPDNDPHGPTEPMIKVSNWQKYRDLMHYPYDLNMPGIRFGAAAGEATVYRQRMIGPQLEAKALSGILTGICERESVTV